MKELRITDFPPELHKALKYAALDHDLSLREFCFQILEKGMKDFVKKPGTLRRRPRTVKPKTGE